MKPRREPRRAPPAASTPVLADQVRDAVRAYLEELDGESPTDLHELVMGEVEVPLLQVVLEHTGNNQSRAAAMLGLNRGTLRSRLRRYGLGG